MFIIKREALVPVPCHENTNRNEAALFNFGTGLRWVLRFSLRPLYPGRKEST